MLDGVATLSFSELRRYASVVYLRSRLFDLAWRTRLKVVALFVGATCGLVCAAYEIVTDYVLEVVWREQGPTYFKTHFAFLPEWVYIVCVCTSLGFLVGVFIRLFGEPCANLPGVVQEFYAHGKLDHKEAPAMALISMTGIVGAGSLGPEAPLVSIGGGFASLVCAWLELSRAETIFITLAGMGAGLAAFFGEPVGGAIFACEVIHRNGLEYYEAFLPTVISGTACNFIFRFVMNLPQKAIWFIPTDEGAFSTIATLHGVALGVLGGWLGRMWIDNTIWLRANVLVPCGLGPRHILKGALGGLLIGVIGAVLPPTLFWAEHESQALLDGGATALPYAWPVAGVFGPCDLSNPLVLLLIGLLKLMAISITVLAGYRGGFIFPFYFCGIAFGLVVHKLVPGVDLATAALSLAAAINTSVTRTVLATPVVLISLSGRPDVLPVVLVASVVSLFMTGDAAIIKAARARRPTKDILGQTINKHASSPAGKPPTPNFKGHKPTSPLDLRTPDTPARTEDDDASAFFQADGVSLAESSIRVGAEKWGSDEAPEGDVEEQGPTVRVTLTPGTKALLQDGSQAADRHVTLDVGVAPLANMSKLPRRPSEISALGLY